MDKKEILYFTELNYATPGGRYYTDGINSGEEYYEKILQSKIHDAVRNEYKIIFDDKDIYGLPFTYFRTMIELSCETYGPLLVNLYIDIDRSNVPDDIKKLFHEIIEFYLNKPIGYKHPDNLYYAKRYN